MKKTKSKPKETLLLFRRSLIYQTKEFFSNSTLHGVRYIAESGRPFGEKFMWFCFTSTGAVSALVIIMSLWEKFQTNPTITGLDTDFHNQQIIFPTTVICPDNTSDDTRVADVAYKELSQYEQDEAQNIEPFLRILTQLTFDNLNEAYELSQKFSASALAQKSLRQLAFEVKINCEDVLEYCNYRDEEVKCCPHFDPIYSEHGFCYAFNSKFKSRDIADEAALEYHDLFETDKKWSLYFVPKLKSRIFIHSHYEYFGWDYGSMLTWDTDHSAELLISMKQTYTTEDAQQLSIGQRKCIFPDEVKLDYYNDKYTFTGCMKDCRMKKCIKLCKCIPPFFKPVRNVPYCKVQSLGCLAKYMENITEIKDCEHCELSCSKTVYDIEKLNKNIGEGCYEENIKKWMHPNRYDHGFQILIDEEVVGEFNGEQEIWHVFQVPCHIEALEADDIEFKSFERHDESNPRQLLKLKQIGALAAINYEKNEKVFVNIEFLTWPIIRYKREVLFGWVDLLVSFGGIAGLFLGFSLLSGVEIIYYFTMRACCMLYKNRDELKKIEDDIRSRPPPKYNMSLKVGKKRLERSVSMPVPETIDWAPKKVAFRKTNRISPLFSNASRTIKPKRVKVRQVDEKQINRHLTLLVGKSTDRLKSEELFPYLP